MLEKYQKICYNIIDYIRMLQQHRKGVTFLPKFESGMENMADMFVFETGDLLEKLDEILMRTEQEDSIS